MGEFLLSNGFLIGFITYFIASYIGMRLERRTWMSYANLGGRNKVGDKFWCVVESKKYNELVLTKYKYEHLTAKKDI